MSLASILTAADTTTQVWYKAYRRDSLNEAVKLFSKGKQSAPRPELASRTVAFTKGELVGLIWSLSGDNSKSPNRSHIAAIREVIKAADKSATTWQGTAYLVPDAAKGRIVVEVDGHIVDQLTPESQAKVADRVTTAVPVKCRLEIVGRPGWERHDVTLYHTR